MRTFTVNGKPVQVANSFKELNSYQSLRWLTDVYLPLRHITEVKGDRAVVRKGEEEPMDEVLFSAIDIVINDPDLMATISIPQILEQDIQEEEEEDNEPIVFSNVLFLIEKKLHQFLFDKPDLKECIVPAFNSWFCPGKDFKDIRLEEYFFADEFYKTFLQTEDWECLIGLAACLYRPKRKGVNESDESFDGDFREKFNRHTLELRMKQLNVEKDSEFLASVFLWFHTCRLRLVDRFPLLYERSTGKSPALKSEEELVELAGGAFQYDTNKHQFMLLIFADLHGKIKRAK